MGAELRLGSCVGVSKTCVLHQMSHSFIYFFILVFQIFIEGFLCVRSHAKYLGNLLYRIL